MDKPEGVKEFHNYGFGIGFGPRPKGDPASEETAPVSDRISAGSLVVAGLLIAVGILGGIWVVYDAQYQFALLHNYENETAAHIQAAVPELVWIAMALVGLSQALRGRKSARVTSHILLFFSLSMGAQLMYAMPNPGGYLVAIITPLALAILLETFIDGVYRWAKSRDGEPPEERSILATVGRVLRRIPKLMWLLPAALLVGFVLDFHGTVQGTRAVLLAVIPWAPLVLLAYPLAWLIRLWLDEDSTKNGLADWLKDHIPYAPGRTKIQDDAAAAREQAEKAELGQAEIERLSGERVREEQRRADEAIKAEREERRREVDELRAKFAADQRAVQQAADTREKRARQEHAETVSDLTARIRQVEAASDEGVAQAKAEAEQRLAQARQDFERTVAAERRSAEQQVDQLRAEYDDQVRQARQREGRLAEQVRTRTARVDELTGQVQTLLQSVSGRDRLLWAYQELGRRGDPRFGRRDRVREVVRELLTREEIGLSSENTACNYVVSWLDDHPAAVVTESADGRVVVST